MLTQTILWLTVCYKLSFILLRYFMIVVLNVLLKFNPNRLLYCLSHVLYCFYGFQFVFSLLVGLLFVLFFLVQCTTLSRIRYAICSSIHKIQTALTNDLDLRLMSDQAVNRNGLRKHLSQNYLKQKAMPISLIEKAWLTLYCCFVC